MRLFAGTIAFVLSMALVDAAQAQRCPLDEDASPWTSVDAGEIVAAATARPNQTTLGFCSTNAGLGGAADAYRYAFQMRDGDFVLEALVNTVDPGGSAGLVAVVPGVQSAEAARIVAEVRVSDDGTAMLYSSVRRASEGTTDPEIEAVSVSLPVSLRLVREGAELRTEIVDVATHLTVVLEAEEELMGSLRVGPFHASNDPAVTRNAEVSRISLSAPLPGPEPECVDAVPAMGGAPFNIRGRHLDQVEDVRIAGMPAVISEASASRLVVEAPTVDGAQVSGPVEIVFNGRTRKVGTAHFTGGAIRRGDVDGDGEVGIEDVRQLCYNVYRSTPLECSAAGDVNGDGNRDAGDFEQLRRFVESGEEPPAEPFEAPGWIPGSLACQLPDRPELHTIELEDGAAVDRPIREGDTLVLVGEGLPAPERAVVRFGNTPTRVSADSTPQRLVVRVGPVPQAGPQCPRIFDAEPPSEDGVRLGPAYGLPEGADLCPAFEASDLPEHSSAEVVDGQLEITVPPTALRPGTRLRVELSLHLPLVVGRSRGPRDVSFIFQVPETDYATALRLLAGRLRKAIHGQSSDECDCEVAVTDVWSEEKLILPPCSLLPDLPEPPPEPVVPGLPTQVQPTRIIWTQMDIWSDLPPPGCNGEIDRETEPRRFFWCELEDLAQIQGDDVIWPPYEGLPLWETYWPIHGVMELDPRDRSTYEKKILVDPTVRSVLEQAYSSGCEMALRATQCEDYFFSTWMPRFWLGGRVIKTFWKPIGDLPASVDETALYSYDPPGGEVRKYLVGMHVGSSINSISGDDEPPDYFEWSTFWLPGGGDDTTKDGSPLSTVFSPNCTTGTGADRPASLAGTPFALFSMCTDSREEKIGCGNPWEASECPPSGTGSCNNCHVAMGKVYFYNPDTPFVLEPLRVGWLASIVSVWSAGANACLLDIDQDPSQFPEEWLSPGPLQDAPNCPIGF